MNFEAAILDECHEYYHTYINKVRAGDVFTRLHDQMAETQQFFAGLSEEKGLHRYASGKWSIKEVAGHIADAERVFSFRAMSFARGETTPMPSMDQNIYVDNGAFDNRTIASLAEELKGLREANIALFQSLSNEALARQGTASGNVFSVRSVFIIAGHERHHLDILKEKYLG